MISIDSLLNPVSADSPCGPDLYEDNFIENSILPLLSAAKGESAMGAVDADRGDSGPSGTTAWREIQEIASDHLRETKHLSLGWYWLLSTGRLKGIEGLESGVRLLSELLSRFAENLHPEDSSNDHSDRQTIIDRLDEGDVGSLIRDVAVVKGRLAGTFSLGDYRRSLSGEGVDLSVIQHAYGETLRENPDFHDQLLAELVSLREALDELSATCAEAFQSYRPKFSKLKTACSDLESAIAELGGHAPSNVNDSPTTGGANSATAPAGPRPLDAISSREDVVKALGRIIQFYQRSEPTSPVPILLQRAQRVVMMDFKEIVREFNLSGSPSIQEVLGWRDED